MTEHISIDDMMDFIFAGKLDDTVLAASAKINAHLAQCDTCWETYNKLLTAKETLDSAFNYTSRNERAKQNLLEGLLEFQSSEEGISVRIADCISALGKLKAAVKLKVESVYSLIGEQLTGGAQYYHPAFAVAAKSAGQSKQDDKTIQSTIVDGNRNRISIGLDRTLAAFFNKDECPVNTLVVLIPTTLNSKPYFKYSASYDAHTVVARFSDVEPGEYIIAFKE